MSTQYPIPGPNEPERRPPLLGHLLTVRPGELPVVLWSAAYYFCLLFSYYLVRPVRETIAVRNELENLPLLWTGTTVAMLLCTPVFGFVVSRLPRRRFVPWLYRFFLVCVLVFFVMLKYAPQTWAGGGQYAFYIWASVFNLFIVSVFWGFMADIFTLEQGKRLFGLLAIGGTLGAICGSIVPAALADGVQFAGRTFKVTAPQQLLMSAALLEITAQCAGQLIRMVGLGASSRTRPVAPREPGPGALAGLVLVARSGYLQRIAVYMLLFTFTSTLLYFEQARIVKATIEGESAQRSYFGQFDLIVNLLTLGIQLFVTGHILKRLGILTALCIIPVATAVGFGALWASPTLAVLVVFFVARRALHYAVDRPTREVLYTILGPDEKYKSKSFIDTFVYRGGDLIGAWAALPLGAAGGLLTVCISLAWIGLGLSLGRTQRRLTRPSTPGAASPPAS